MSLTIENNTAIIVHNNVYKDARVRKGIRTLVSNDFEVDVFGLDTSNEVHNGSIDGSNSFELSNPNNLMEGVLYSLFVRYKRASQLAKDAIIIGGATVFFLLVISIYNVFNMDTAVIFLVFSVIFYYLQNRIFRIIKSFIIFPRSRMNKMSDALYEKVKLKKYKYIHCHDLIALDVGVRYKKRYPSVILIWDAHELYQDVTNITPQHKQYCEDVILSSIEFIDKFITINDSFSSIYKSRYPLLPKATVVMNATRYDKEDVLTSKSPLRNATNIDAEQKILLFQGGFSRSRGIEKLLEVAKTLSDEWSIVFMGWGTLEPVIDRAAVTLNDRRPDNKPVIRVIPPASQSELRLWTSGATLGIIPYEDTCLNHLYCTPNKLWEYPNSKVPVLATGLVEIEKMVSKWKTGKLLPVDFSPEDINCALNSITDDNLEVWRKHCLVFSEEMSWQKFEPNLLAVYI
mgnify:CR=1 FL=1